MSTQADTAKAIRTELKKEFPLVKFSVKSRSFAGGDSVDISWIDGPTYDMVAKLTSKYQYGNFDGMRDLYEYTNSRKDIPQVKYVLRQRQISDEVTKQMFSVFQRTYMYFDQIKDIDESSEILLKEWGSWTARNYICRILSTQDLTHGYKGE